MNRLQFCLPCLFLVLLQVFSTSSFSGNAIPRLRSADAAAAAATGGGKPSQTLSENLKAIEAQWADLEFPATRDFRQRSKPFTVNVEGIVGTGKSTFLNFFKKYPLVDILPEPVDRWTNVNGTDLLKLIYDNPKRWAMAQESYVQLTMLEEHMRRFGVAKIMERSLFSGRYVFVENFYRSGLLSKVEYAVLSQWHDFLYYVPEFDISTDLTVYLQAKPEAVMERIKKRGRPEEANISMAFLDSIYRLHEDWLLHKNTTFPLPSKRVIVIDTDRPLSEMKIVYESLAKKIWSIVPQELKQEDLCHIRV